MKLGVLMDPIETIHYKKDSTLAMLWEAAKRGWEIFYFQQKDLFLKTIENETQVFAHTKKLKVYQDANKWFEFGEEKIIPLNHLHAILMRKDPPFNQEYIYTTYLLEHAEKQGVVVVNRPQSLRDANEKLITTWFPQCSPATLVTRSIQELKKFWHEHKDIICKPLEAMGGASVFRLREGDMNASVIFEVLTKHETAYMMAQTFIPQIKEGDKRILIIDGKPVPYALARIPAPGELRGNLAAGAKGVAVKLTARDYWICEKVGPMLKEKGLFFAGLDVIGDYLTEINVTSPTCIRELDEQCNLNISATLMDCIERIVPL